MIGQQKELEQYYSGHENEVTEEEIAAYVEAREYERQKEEGVNLPVKFIESEGKPDVFLIA